ncbi:hypothetical protein AVEN_84486-1 [Araneus ventricosus]|uniref:Uncharacterized protein n=1 Tax=Araneus ventricosus TaxID=182803 RepID=A0A4Y2UDQ5_ARAVE|nr:hypothetical protein AVEN_84486-1 [Araneus ventricosus]
MLSSDKKWCFQSSGPATIRNSFFEPTNADCLPIWRFWVRGSLFTYQPLRTTVCPRSANISCRCKKKRQVADPLRHSTRTCLVPRQLKGLEVSDVTISEGRDKMKTTQLNN